MNKPNATGVRAGNPKNTSAKKIYSINGPKIPLSGGKASFSGPGQIVNK